MRAMLLEFPEDPTAAVLDLQYMLGGSLLVAPVFADDGEVTYYVPVGRWTHLTTGATVTGPGWVTEHHDSSTLPLLVRAGSVIAMGARSDRADYDFADGVTLRAYELAEDVKVAVAVPEVGGGTDSAFEVTRAAGVVVAEQVRGSKPWRLLLVNAVSELGVTGGAAENTPEGMLVTAAPGSPRIEIRLAG
jgi:alpha-D-xyloside xylohydrolase